MKTNIGIITGGYDAERVVSLKSAEVVKKNISTYYNPFIIDVTKDGWFDIDSGSPVNLNDFSITIHHQKILLQKAFMCLHGSPAEDGLIQGYFEIKKIPYTGCGVACSAITMDKELSKKIASQSIGIATAKYILLSSAHSRPSAEQLEKLTFPLFVKPNDAGSSFGVSKVKQPSELEAAILEAFKHSQKVLIEEYIDGRELAHGVLELRGQKTALPITEVVSENEFFDYQAKYEGKSKELTPAPNISSEMEAKIKETSLKLFDVFGCRGLTRFDYFLRGNELFFLEANTLPGLSEASIFPQQLVAHGISLETAFCGLLEEI